MRAVIDQERCEGHLRCMLIAPDVFDEDDIGHALVTADPVPVDDENAARRAAANCPQRAITLND